VENIGDALATTSTLELDVDGDITTYQVPCLAPAETHQVQRQVLFGAAGSYAVQATADLYGDVNESDETNNTAMDTIDVGDMPDLIVSSLDHSPGNPFINDTITLTAVVKNIGGEPATTSTLELDVEGEAGPITFTIPLLLPDESAQVQTQVTKVDPGTYQVTATADFDDDNVESSEDNNVSVHEFVVRGPGPDLIISALDYEPAMLFTDQPSTITVVVENAGDAEATSSTLWILIGSEIIPETFEIEPLNPAESFQVQLQLIVSDPGAYTITATADAEDNVAESVETNNDEIIDIDVYNSDPAKVRQYILGILALTEEEKPFYDINQDGIVDIADLISLLVL
jgi:subtilase family serine protease